MPFYDFTRGQAKEFSLKELVAKIAEVERRRQAGHGAKEDEGGGNPWQKRERPVPPAQGEPLRE